MNYGIKAAKKGVDVFTADIKDKQTFNSGRYVEKIKEVFEVSENTTEVDFRHGLNYTPVLIDYRNLNSSGDTNDVGISASRIDNFEVILTNVGAVAGRGIIGYVLFQAGS